MNTIDGAPAWTKLHPIDAHYGGCLNCGPRPAQFPPDDVIAVGFGYAALHKDGVPFWTELNDVVDDELMTGADAEALAAQDPDHDWRIVLHGPLSGRTYQRHGPGQWMLVEKNFWGSMKHYHGTPIGGTRQDVARFLIGRHALVPYPRQDDMGIVADACQSFVFDNGAFSVWKRGEVLDVPGYMAWVRDWCRHPGFEWALIPDVIDGDEQANDVLISQFADADLGRYGVPVWHMHESLDRLARLCDEWPTVALGSSGQWATPGTAAWWQRMSEAMDAACDDQGRPRARLHGLRMMDPEIFTRLPLASADSTNAAVNCGSVSRFGSYIPPTAAQRAAVIAERIEAQNSAPVWVRRGQQAALLD